MKIALSVYMNVFGDVFSAKAHIKNDEVEINCAALLWGNVNDAAGN